MCTKGVNLASKPTTGSLLSFFTPSFFEQTLTESPEVIRLIREMDSQPTQTSPLPSSSTGYEPRSTPFAATCTSCSKSDKCLRNLKDQTKRSAFSKRLETFKAFPSTLATITDTGLPPLCPYDLSESWLSSSVSITVDSPRIRSRFLGTSRPISAVLPLTDHLISRVEANLSSLRTDIAATRESTRRMIALCDEEEEAFEVYMEKVREEKRSKDHDIVVGAGRASIPRVPTTSPAVQTSIPSQSAISKAAEAGHLTSFNLPASSLDPESLLPTPRPTELDPTTSRALELAQLHFLLLLAFLIGSLLSPLLPSLHVSAASLSKPTTTTSFPSAPWTRTYDPTPVNSYPRPPAPPRELPKEYEALYAGEEGVDWEKFEGDESELEELMNAEEGKGVPVFEFGDSFDEEEKSGFDLKRYAKDPFGYVERIVDLEGGSSRKVKEVKPSPRASSRETPKGEPKRKGKMVPVGMAGVMNAGMEGMVEVGEMSKKPTKEEIERWEREDREVEAQGLAEDVKVFQLYVNPEDVM